jgi:polysaccharide pyruvyl transferase WcaK-like protein
MAFKWILAAWIWRRKILLVSVGAGPIRHPLSRFFLTAVAQMASYRTYRDKGSREFMQSLGIDVSADKVFPDIVFSLPVEAKRCPAKVVPIIGVGVMSYLGWLKGNSDGEAIYSTYLRKLKAFVVWLLDQGYDIRLLTGDVADWPAVENLRDEIDRSHCGHKRVKAMQTNDLSGLMDEIDETDVVVVTRYHNVVSALKLGRPVISIEYSQKNQALMDEMGLGDFCQHIEKLDLDLLKRQFQRIVGERPAIRRRILQMDCLFRKRLVVQEGVLANMLGEVRADRASKLMIG